MKHRDRVSFGLLAAALGASVLLVGGAVRSTQALVAVAVAGALGVQLLARRRLDRVSPLLVFIGTAVALCVLQLVPLPEGLREWLNPAGEALRRDGAAIAGTSPWPSLSLDPPGTLRALVFFTTLLGLGAVALRFAASERGRFALLATVALACGAAALVAGIHAVLGADALYGLYDPTAATPRVFGPLLNGNHMGSLMAIGTVLSIGLAFYLRQNVRLRVLWILNSLGCLVVLLATLSRGAVLAVVCGVVVTVAAMLAQRIDQALGTKRRRRSSALTSQLPIAIVIAFGLGLAVYSGAGKVASQLDNTTLAELSQPSSKYAAWKSAVKLVIEAPWTGIGRGALEPVFTRVHDPAAFVTFSHLENEYLQAVVEFGVLGAIVLAAGFCWCLLASFRRWRDGPLAAAALGAIAGVLLQSTVDFGIELLGLAVPLTIVAATLLLVPLREGAPSLRPRVQRGVLVAALLLGALLVLQPCARSVQEDHDALLASGSLDDVHEVIERHPVDYFPFGHAAGVMMRTGDPRAAKYLNHALALHPTHPGLHRLVARILIATNRPSQAAVQYALAVRRSATPGKLVDEILALMPDADQAAQALPTDRETIELIFRALHDRKREDVAIRWLARAIVQPQSDTSVVDRLIKLAMDRKDYVTAEHAARARLRISRTTTSRLVLARVHAARADHDALLAELRDVSTWRGRIDEKSEAWMLVCDVHIARKHWDQAVECLHRLDGSGAVTPGGRSEVTRRLTSVKDQRTLEARQQAIELMERDLQRKQPRP